MGDLHRIKLRFDEMKEDHDFDLSVFYIVLYVMN